MYFTEKQLRILEFIQQFREERGISPTLEEIAANFGVTKITIYEHINQLERKGALKREKFRARSIELLVPVEKRTARFALPLRGKLEESGAIAPASQEESLDLTTLVPLGKRCYVLRVTGDALAGEHITDGDYAIVEENRTPRDGDIVVTELEPGRPVLKKYFLEKNRVRLQSTNGGLKPLYVKDPAIRGVVIGIVRRFDAREPEEQSSGPTASRN